MALFELASGPISLGKPFTSGPVVPPRSRRSSILRSWQPGHGPSSSRIPVGSGPTPAKSSICCPPRIARANFSNGNRRYRSRRGSAGRLAGCAPISRHIDRTRYMSERVIPLTEPSLKGNEHAYLDECIRSNFVSSIGPFVERFEREFAAHVGATFAVACSSGTAALHVAL